MKLQAVLLVTAGITTLSLAIVGSVRGASQQIWNPQMAHAARVTATLFKKQSFNPMRLARVSRPAKSPQSFALQLPHADDLVGYTSGGRVSVTATRGAWGQRISSVGSRPQVNRQTLEDPLLLPINQPAPTLQSTEFQNWIGSVEGTLRKQNYEIKKLDYQLAQEQYRNGWISRGVLNQKAQEYQRSSEEFKAFLDSLRMAKD